MANIAGIDIEILAKNMFQAGSDFNRKTLEETVDSGAYGSHAGISIEGIRKDVMHDEV